MRRFVTVRTMLVAAGICLVTAFSPAAETQKLPAGPQAAPTWAQVEKTMTQFYAAEKGRKPLDIITRGQTRPLFDRLAQLGWKVRDREDLLARIPDDNEFVVRQLKSKQGRQFMREFSKYPEGYDKLDQLAKLPHGKSTVKRLVAGPDGYKLLQYLNTTPGGANMQKQLANAPKGKGFTQPTGRIYTAPALKAELKKSYAAAFTPPQGNKQR